MKILITGSPGSGKSAVAYALKVAGYASYDGEEVQGLIRLEVKATSEPADWPGGHIDWNYYAWNIQKDVLKDLLATHQDVFLALTASNIDDFLPLFDKVLVLSVPDDELSRRLRARTTHEYGQDDADITRWVRHNQKVLSSYIEKGAIFIDNSGVLDITVSGILELWNNTNN